MKPATAAIFIWSTRSGKRRTPVFDNAKMAAMLTGITRIPYDSQHLPIRTIKFIKNDTMVEFELQVEQATADINGTQTVIGVARRPIRPPRTGSSRSRRQDNPQQRARPRRNRRAASESAHADAVLRIRPVAR